MYLNDPDASRAQRHGERVLVAQLGIRGALAPHRHPLLLWRVAPGDVGAAPAVGGGRRVYSRRNKKKAPPSLVWFF